MRTRCWTRTIVALIVLLGALGGNIFGNSATDQDPIGEPNFDYNIDAHKVLEGITEPFDNRNDGKVPAWKALKMSADDKANNHQLQQALKEYGYILRQAHIFAEMPMYERYDIFLSMARLLKFMGFHQRAEALLYESLNYAQAPGLSPFQSHFELSLLALEKEDLVTAKMHLKNCLFLKEADTLVLIHFAVILMAEGKTHEAKFYISRILSALEGKVARLVEMMKSNDMNSLFGAGKGNGGGDVMMTGRGRGLGDMDEGKAQRSDSATVYNSNLNKWNRKRSRPRRGSKAAEAAAASDGTGAGGTGNDNDLLPFVDQVEHSDLQAWLEQLMIRVFHGDYLVTGASFATENDNHPSLALGGFGAGSGSGGHTKTANLLETFQMFSNLYDWLADGEMSGRFVFDIGQSLYECGKSEIGHSMMRRGHLTSNPKLEGVVSIEVVKIRLALDYPVVSHSVTHLVEAFLNMTQFLSLSSTTYEPIDIENIMDVYWPLPLFPFSGLFTSPILKELLYRFNGGPTRQDSESMLWLADALNENSFAASEPETDGDHAGTDTDSEGASQSPRIEVGIFGGHMNNHPVGLFVLHRLLSLDRTKFRITLIATPLHADHITRDIAARVDEIVNLPMATERAWSIIEQKLHLDIVLFPDWQPFPDQLNILYESRRIAPVQVCFYVLGSSCAAGNNVDYYLLPDDVHAHYAKGTSVSYAVTTASRRKQAGGGSGAAGGKGTVADYSIVIPPWLEAFHEQVVVLDWPVLNTQTVSDIGQVVSAMPDDVPFPSQAMATQSQNSNQQQQPTSGGSSSSPYPGGQATPFPSSQAMQLQRQYAALAEIEGQIFFENQPVAILAIHPSLLHPLMDAALINILRATTASQLQIVLALPEVHFNNAMLIPKFRISWARRLVRRLWQRAGTYSNRIRLLPSPVSDKRLLSLYKQADIVLDTFPLGGSLHSHALALSVGTPVVTMMSGIQLSTPLEDAHEMRRHLALHARRYEHNPVFTYIMKNDVPWVPTNMPVGGFYSRLVRNAVPNTSTSTPAGGEEEEDGGSPFRVQEYTIEDLLVAHSVKEYEAMVVHLAEDRAAAYNLRVKLLEAIDRRVDHQAWSAAHGGGNSDAGVGLPGTSGPLHHRKTSTTHAMNNDLEGFLLTAGRGAAAKRVKRAEKIQQTTDAQQRARKYGVKKQEKERGGGGASGSGGGGVAAARKEAGDEAEKRSRDRQKQEIKRLIEQNQRQQQQRSNAKTAAAPGTGTGTGTGTQSRPKRPPRRAHLDLPRDDAASAYASSKQKQKQQQQERSRSASGSGSGSGPGPGSSTVGGRRKASAAATRQSADGGNRDAPPQRSYNFDDDDDDDSYDVNYDGDSAATVGVGDRRQQGDEAEKRTKNGYFRSFLEAWIA